MTPEISLRTFTDDQYVLDKVFYANNYRLKQLPEKDKVTVLDIGAHIGTFSLLCLMRGAEKVYAVEPFSDNHRMLTKNLKDFADKSSTLKLGIYTETRFATLEYPENENNFFYLSNVKLHSKGEDVPSDLTHFVKLDELLAAIPETEVDILKIHTTYAEAEILLSSEHIGKCNYICGEMNLTKEKIQELIQSLEAKGFKDSFFAESKEKEGEYLCLFAKEKCEDLFNLYVAGSPEAEAEEQQQQSLMTQFPSEG